MKKMGFVLLMLGLAGLGCRLMTLSPEPTPTTNAVEANHLATVVQQTLQALAPVAPPAATVAPVEPTSAVEPVAPAAAPTSAPVQQPGGLTVAYAVDGNIYLWQPGLGPRQVTEHGQAVEVYLSPDAEWIAYTKYNGESRVEVWAVRADGSRDGPVIIRDDLVSPDPALMLNPYQITWLPASHTLYYTTFQQYLEGPGGGPTNDLRMADVESGQKAVLLTPGSGGQFYLSPDGQKLLLVQYDRFIMASHDGSGAREIFTYPFVYTYSEWTYLPDPVWLPTSTAFRVIIPAQDPLANPEEPTYIWEIPADGSPARQLSQFTAAAAFFARPLLSPDATRVAYQTQDKPEGPTTSLHIATVDLSSDLVLQSGQFNVQSWSPDSLRVMIWSNQRMEMQIASLTGSFLAWPVGIQPWDLRWVDGHSFLILNGSRDRPELYLGTLEGQFVQLATASMPNLSFDFVK